MTIYSFTTPKVTPLCWWRVDSNPSTNSRAAITPPNGGAAILGRLRSDEKGVLSATNFRGPDGVSQLYLKRMTSESGGTVVAGATVTLDTGVALPDPTPTIGSGGQAAIDTAIANLQAKFAPLTAHQAVQGIKTVLVRGRRSIAIQNAGDSTGDEIDEHFGLLGQLLGGQFPNYTVTFNKWDGTNERYTFSPNVIQAGTSGDRAYDIRSNVAFYLPGPNVVGDVGFRMRIKPDTWNPGALQWLIGKVDVATNQRSVGLALNPGKYLSLYTSADGATPVNITAKAPLPFVDGDIGWVRAEHDVDNGASGHTVTFYSSPDNVTWTQIGSPVTTAGVTSHFASTANWTLGCRNQTTAASDFFTGAIYEVHIADGILDPNRYHVMPTLPEFWEPTGASGYGGAGYTLSGSPVLQLWDGSMSGQGVPYADLSTRRPKLFANVGQRLLMVNIGMNDPGLWSSYVTGIFATWIGHVKTLIPGTPIIVLGQNPVSTGTLITTQDQIDQRQQRQGALLQYADSQAGMWAIDMLPAWPAVFDPTLYADGYLHPSKGMSGGSGLEARYLLKVMFGLVDGITVTSGSSSSSSSSGNGVSQSAVDSAIASAVASIASTYATQASLSSTNTNVTTNTTAITTNTTAIAANTTAIVADVVAVRSVPAAVRGIPVVLDGYVSAASSYSRQAVTGTFKVPFKVSVACTDLRLGFVNWTAKTFVDTDNASPVTISAAVEYNSTVFPVTFNGRYQATLDGGAIRFSDPLALDIPAGATINIRTYPVPIVHTAAATTSASGTVTDAAIVATDTGRLVTGTGIPANTYVGTVTAGTSFLLSSSSTSQAGSVTATATTNPVTLTFSPLWYPTRLSNGSAGGFGGYGAGDLTAMGSAAISGLFAITNLLAPSVILGNPANAIASVPSVFVVGDSIDSGMFDGSNVAVGINPSFPKTGGGGWMARAMDGVGGLINAGTSSDTAANAALTANHWRRYGLANYASNASVGYGTNDISSGAGLSTVQANVITIWTILRNRKLRVFARTILPRTTSTDGWITTTNQTVVTGEANRVSYNTWLRAGAPMASGVAVAVGTSGALLAGQTGHPLYAVFDVAAAVESSLNSGFWAPSAGTTRTVTDGVSTASGFTVTSATGNFVAANDTGRTIIFTGAGTAGATYTGNITTVYSTTSIGVSPATPTAVASGGTIQILDAMTDDGIHPKATASVLMAAAVDTTKLI